MQSSKTSKMWKRLLQHGSLMIKLKKGFQWKPALLLQFIFYEWICWLLLEKSINSTLKMKRHFINKHTRNSRIIINWIMIQKTFTLNSKSILINVIHFLSTCIMMIWWKIHFNWMWSSILCAKSSKMKKFWFSLMKLQRHFWLLKYVLLIMFEYHFYWSLLLI